MSWWGLGGLGAHLGPKSEKSAFDSRSSTPLGAQDGLKLGAKTHPKSIRKPSKKQYFLLVLWSGFGGVWPQLGANLDAKTFPESTQVCSKLDPKWCPDVDNLLFCFLIALGTFFVNVDSKLERRGTQKH